MMPVPSHLHAVIQALTQAQFRPLFVGGAVRDFLMGRTPTEYDLEVFGAPNLDTVFACLSPHFNVQSVGKNFGVLKIIQGPYQTDISLPRTETKTGLGHRGFEISTYSDISFEIAAYRRDFTINAMGFDPTDGTLLDPFDGQSDLQSKQLKAVSASFEEDPLRVLRAAQLAGRLGFNIEPKTIQRCRHMPLNELPQERIGAEILKLITLAPKPSLGFKWFPVLGIMPLFPELMAMQGCLQDASWHLEGDAWTHTLMVLDEIAALPSPSPEEALIFRLAALCHDLGKPLTTRFLNGRWRALGHESAGLSPAKQLMKRLCVSEKIITSVLPLVQNHMVPGQLAKANQIKPISDSVIRRLSTKVSISQLATIAQADHRGRISTAEAEPLYQQAGHWLLSRSAQLKVSQNKPQPFITGNDLIKRGIPPGKLLGKYLKKSYYAQLSGRSLTRADAMVYLDTLLKKDGYL